MVLYYIVFSFRLNRPRNESLKQESCTQEKSLERLLPFSLKHERGLNGYVLLVTQIKRRKIWLFLIVLRMKGKEAHSWISVSTEVSQSGLSSPPFTTHMLSFRFHFSRLF